MAPTRKNWLSKNIKQCEALLEELYRERDARTNWEMQPPQVEEHLVKLQRSVDARRWYETNVLIFFDIQSYTLTFRTL